jgi:uncharacterized protein YfaS (alpha-2-macroglobulin family)
MGKLFKSKIIIGTLAFLVIVAALLYFRTAKSAKNISTSFNPAFSEYISAFTAGTISSGSPLRISFSKDVVDSSSTGREAPSFFDLSPSVKGKMFWLDRRTVEFRPDKRLQSGQLYQVEFALAKILDVPKDLATFEYAIDVMPQNFEWTIDNIKPYVKTELKRQKIEGRLTTADFAEASVVEKMVTAHQGDHTLRITWAHTSDGKQHLFVVEDVARKETASQVSMRVDGDALSVERKDDREVEISALGDFKVTNVRVEQGTSGYVVVQFSDPLNESQNVDGLITISGLPTLDYEIKDNEVRVYPPVRQKGQRTLTVAGGIKNILNYTLQKGGAFDVLFEQLPPAVRFVGKGAILPSTDGLVLPFEAANLKSVSVKVIKVFENNVLQFLQVNDYDGNRELRRVGKPVLTKSISLENAGITDFGKWNRFTLDLSSMIKAEPGAIYQVRISFRRSDALYGCDQDTPAPIENRSSDDESWSQQGEDEGSAWDYAEYYYGPNYDWQQRENPCHDSYYTGEHNISKNILASDLGLIAKRGADGNTLVIVTDLKTAKPVSGVALELYDYQLQLVGSVSSDADGKAIITSKDLPFALIAKNGTQRGYLKIPDGESLSLSNFDVGGEHISKGLKGLLYGERGVWRPGDSLYLTFILEDKLKLLPAGHPVVFELQNPQGQITTRLVKSTGENGFYKFATATSSEDPTGNWLGRVKVGGTEFTQPLKIEMVKPNRLRIKLDFGIDKITAGTQNVTGDLQVDWLHGAPGKNLKTQFEVLLTKAETKFARYPDFTFEDPTRTFSSETKPIFDGFTNEKGHANFNATLEQPADAPGMLNAVFRGKAFEESGNYSIDKFSIPFYPYESFTGIRLPAGDRARGMLLTDTTHTVDIVTVDADGNPVAHNGIQMTIYKLKWRWWWDQSGEGNVNYMTGTDERPIVTGTVNSVNGKASWTFRINHPEWGRFLVKAVDPISGHSTGKVVYIDWPGWAGRSREDSQGATMLSFTSDKTKYNIGEQVNLIIPGAENGRALVSVESGSTVLKTFWVETIKGDNKFGFEATREMTPNVFVHVTLLQPHAQTANDLPIRLYGVIPIGVEDPHTHLNPVLSMADELEPGQEVTLRVSEKDHRKMTYTVAVVDEGLLDLTHFKTPDAWSRFNAREALGVKTWDLFDNVIGSFGGKIERLLAIGGDDESRGKKDDPKANRFKPVVKYFGPFTLDGGTAEHKFVMPQYVGSVKTMVVAGYEGAYGKTDKATPVRKPLMVLATLPRVLGPEETLRLPITLFSSDKSIATVKIDVKVSGPLTLPEGASRSVALPGIGDKTTDFALAVKGETGIAKVEVTATSENYKATDVIEIQVRNPNPPISKSQETILETGKSWNTSVAPLGMAGSNSAVLEVSSLPPINLGQRLKYLLQYPYGCIEQTTSSVFPQLYLDQVKQLTDAEKATIQSNVRAGIERLKLFVTSDGGFSYWPGHEDADSWSTAYAGHFLVEAEAKGYFVPNDMLKRWKKFQRNKAQSWRKNEEFSSSELIQAYRLYTLALAGDPDLGAMNRLREMTMPTTAGWMLAAAYLKAGQAEAAKNLLANLPASVKPYQELGYSYGSDLRDKAIILETIVLQGDRTKGFQLLKEISQELSNSSYWMSTQTVAWCLKAISSFAGSEKRSEVRFSYTYNGKEISANTDMPVAQVTLPLAGLSPGTLKFSNNSKGILFVRVITEGVPARGSEESAENNLSLSITYADTHASPIDPVKLEQGQEFIATVTVRNPGTRGAYKNLAINQIFPSGWEINNLRLEGTEDRLKSDKPVYQDIRDDRVYTYFDLGVSQAKTFRVLLTASYAGSFYLPAVSCEAMYDHGIYARKKGQGVEVVKKLVP